MLTGLDPAGLWRHFEALTTIARPSRHEEAAIEHVRAWAAARGLQVQQDAGRNLVVRVPATAGREAAPVVVLQGHLDMVCERTPDTPNDPAAGRIELVRDGEWLTANGTTLGADDGVGIAAMMALAEDESAPHGPLELLMTVVEEIGVPGEGADGVDPSLLTGSTLFNLDSEEDGTLTVGSASATDSTIRVERPRAPCAEGATTVAVTVTGGLGGHSGIDIARGHANAIAVLARVLRDALPDAGFRLVALDGGGSRNAIPRDARAVCSVPSDRADTFRAALGAAAATVRGAYADTDPGLKVGTAEAAAAPEAWTGDATAELLDLIAVLPSGPIALSPGFAGLVETSTSMGVAATEGNALVVDHLTRSSNDGAAPAVLATLEAAARLAGGTFEIGQSDPGWEPDLDSPALGVTRRVYHDLFGGPPVVTAVHAWLETAAIGQRVPGLDMVSFGPQIEAPHSPDERVRIPTVERFWRLLAGVVDELSTA